MSNVKLHVIGDCAELTDAQYATVASIVPVDTTHGMAHVDVTTLINTVLALNAANGKLKSNANKISAENAALAQRQRDFDRWTRFYLARRVDLDVLLLELLDDGERWTLKALWARANKARRLTKTTAIDALRKLAKFGLVLKYELGVYCITDAGHQFVASLPATAVAAHG
jgi:predicted transcriptional regulator